MVRLKISVTANKKLLHEIRQITDEYIKTITTLILNLRNFKYDAPPLTDIVV